MFRIKLETLLFFMIILGCNCQRRIKNGSVVKVERRYMVYLVKAPISEIGYDYWLCGGAIVSSEFVITSAACVNDVDFLYVISGYNKYITDGDIDTDPCTANMKKRVIYTCSPKGYDLKYGELDYWSYIDIALAKVDTPFDFDDKKYEISCSYKPTTIPINYEEKYQEAGTDALVLGWGHKSYWRKPGDQKNYNQVYLRYAPTLLLNKTACIEHYADYTNMSRVIKTYMICSLGKGNIDDAGNTIQQPLPFANGCTSNQEKLLGFEGVSCEASQEENLESDSYDDEDTRRHDKNKNKTKHIKKTKHKNKTRNVSMSDFNNTRTRRSGICQNDHGGPIVTWAGANEILIGVASVFKVSDDFECMGPYLYTSTLCTGLFLDCILNTEFPSKRSNSRRYLCDRPASERGYDTIERTISWKNHPKGPAANENVERSRPGPKMAPGLKYLINNNQAPSSSNADGINNENPTNQGRMKYPSNMFQAYKNPALGNNASKQRLFEIKGGYTENKSILGQQSIPVNNRQQGPTRDESNNMYLANNNPPIDTAHRDRFKVKQRIPEINSEQKSFLDDRHQKGSIFQSNNKYLANKSPGIVSYARKNNAEMNERSSENKSISGMENFPINNRNSDTQINHDDEESNPANEPPKKQEPAIPILEVRPQHPL